MWRRTVLSSLASSFAALAFSWRKAHAAPEKVLRVAMTLADIPLTTGQPSQGGEGTRFIGVTLYDALVNWNLRHSDRPARLEPGLALSWSVDPKDHVTWTFKLRPGVKFHDGSGFTADAVAWNFSKLRDQKAPQYDPAQAAQGASYFSSVRAWKVVDPLTIEIISHQPDADIPYQLANIFMSSPAQWQAMGRDWTKVAAKPSGTGPWKMDKFVPRTRVELVRNPNYWDPKRITKSDRLVLLPVPDANTRVAALLSGQVDWVEAPPPDAVPRLKSSGMQIVTNIYPHIWPYILSYVEGSPMHDLRVRKALNLAIDRDGLVQLLGGLAKPAKGMVDPQSPWFGKPAFDIKYDPATAKKLLAEAGYGPKKPLELIFAISTAGSGQMQPIPMNDFVQQSLEAVNVKVKFQVMEWEALRHRRMEGAFNPDNKGVDGLNNSWAYFDPDIGLINTSWSIMKPPKGYNWGGYSDPVADKLCQRAKTTFDPVEQDKVLAELHTRIVDQAMWVWVVHDLNPRALGAKVRGYVEARSWFPDLTPVYVD
jgi:peptide/nickel transport system substrate-binding protein